MSTEVTLFSESNKGYGAAGASHTKRSVKGFNAQSGSPREDIDANNRTMRQRGRMLYMSAPVATSGIKTSRTNAIGLGLKLNPKIDWEYLGITAEQAEEWEKNTKAEFKLWAERKNACDATSMNGFYEIQQLAFVSWLVSGDVFVLLKHVDRDQNNPYSLRLHTIEADRCSTPQSGVSYLFNMTEGRTGDERKIYDGVEVDDNGKVVAYHIRNTYPYQITMEKTQWTRIEAYGEKTGLPNIIHIMNAERPEQYRGVSFLAQIIEPILQIRRYTEAEITAAIVQSFFTAFIKTTSDPGELPFNSMEPENEGGTGQERYDPSEYEMGPGAVVMLNQGEEPYMAEPKHPVAGFDEFMKAMCTQMGAALEIPRDLLLKEFNSSYSASRGALLEAWKTFKMYREWFVSDFCRPIYEVWLTEAVALGRVNAPGFFRDRRIKEAWLGAEWIGPSQGQLDPVKEITAEIMAVAEGFSTHEDSTVRLNGGDWASNMNKLRIENEKKKEILGEEKSKENKDSEIPEKNNRDTNNMQNVVMQDMVRSVLKEVMREMIEEEKKIEKEKEE